MSRRPRKTPLAPNTVDLHVRNARTIFNHAVVDDLTLFNPFDRLADRQPVQRDWHYVVHDEFVKLMDATKSSSWKLLLALARWAALRRGEALNLPWSKIDWAKSRLLMISRHDWEVKDKAPRVVPICPELHALLLAAFEEAPEGEPNVIPTGSISVRNLSRDFGNLCKRAGVERYAKPIHSLRKSCITDWASRHPAHVVKQWAGHSDMDTTDRYYLQVSESEYEAAAATPMTAKVAQLVAPPADYRPESGRKTKTEESELTASKEVGEAPNETPLPNDVQLPQLGVIINSRFELGLPAFLAWRPLVPRNPRDQPNRSCQMPSRSSASKRS